MILGIIGAMDLETEQLKSNMTVASIKEIAGLKFYAGELNNNNVVVVTCGIGKVNAATCTQILISEFKADVIINTGVSGAIHQDLNVGDIVISTDCMEHDFDCTAFGLEPGIIPRMDTSIFIADKKMIELAFKASEYVLKTHKTYKGRIVSGDQFVSSLERKNYIEKHFEAHTTEMEGAAIAHVSHLNQIPFVIIRSMSDKADGSAHISFDDFAKIAADHSSQIVMKMLSDMNLNSL